MKYILFAFVAVAGFSSCKKEGSNSGPNVNFIFRFDSTQARLNGQGVAAPVAAGHKGQSPRFNSMSAHYLELTGNALTLPGAGEILYKAPEVTTGGSNAIDFSKSKFAGNNQVFLSVPLTGVSAGTYNYLRVSLAYQNYNVWTKVSSGGNSFMLDATFASFLGFNTYITTHKIKDSVVKVNGDRLQGYWGFEAFIPGAGPVMILGQAAPGATTVPNPLFATSPVPQGSCLVTGMFASPLVITGNETADINIIVSLSTNKSFEWIDADGNSTYDPLAGDQVVDMGVRGMIPSKQ